MDLIRGFLRILTIWMVCGMVNAQETGVYGEHQKPRVQIELSVGKPSPSVPFELNSHLQSHLEGSKPHEGSVNTKFLEDQTVPSVMFNEVQSLVLTKSSFQIISYISFKPHLTTFTHIKDLLYKTLNKMESFLTPKSFPPYYSQLTEQAQVAQNLKNTSI